MSPGGNHGVDAPPAWFRLFRTLVVTAVTLLFLFCLLAIVLTGPIVVRPGRLDLDLDVDPQRMREAVELLCGDLAPRDYTRTENLDRAAAWIAGTMRESGLEVRLQDYVLREGRFRNVIAYQRGREPEVGAVVIGAHYDAYGGFPGADDNASGVAVLLELIRTLPPVQPRSDRYFVAFSTEEPPFFGTDDMGSAVFARSLVEANVHVNLMVALDAVGTFSDRPRSQRFPVPWLRFIYPHTGDFIAVVGDLGAGRWIQRVKRGMLSTRAVPVESFRAPRSFPGVDHSDHLPFRERGLPGVLVTGTAFMRSEHYHTRHDTPEKLDYERMAGVVLALHGVLWDRGTPRPPESRRP